MERFANCEFLKVRVNKRYNIMDHGFVVSKACNFRITVFIFHKLLFVAAIIITIIRDANGPQ